MSENQNTKALQSLIDNDLPAPKDQIYQITFSGQLYEAATDGYLMLACRAEQSDAPELPEKYATRFAGWLKPAMETADAKALSAFLRVSECARCPVCAGTGKRSEMNRHASDEWFFDPFSEARIVSVYGYSINANMLARVLAYMPLESELKLFVPSMDNWHSLVIYGSDWIIMQMSTSATPTDFWPIQNEEPHAN